MVRLWVNLVVATQLDFKPHQCCVVLVINVAVLDTQGYLSMLSRCCTHQNSEPFMYIFY